MKKLFIILLPLIPLLVQAQTYYIRTIAIGTPSDTLYVKINAQGVNTDSLYRLISGSYVFATAPKIKSFFPFQQLSQKPTTRDGYGITDVPTGTGTVSGTNTGDNATNSQYSGLAASKENSINAGLTTQYWRGDKSWQTFPTTTAPFVNSTDKNFVTDAKLTVVNNTTGTNSGDNSANSTYASDYRAANFVAGTNYQAVINGTGFVKATGTTISYDNSTYLTTAAAASTYEPVITTLSFAKGGIGSGAATSATTGAMTVTMNTEMVTITPTGACTFNASGGVTGQRITFVVTTSGVSSFVLTWGTNFKSTATLATGTTTAKIFAVTFLCTNGTQWIETNRTAAQ